MFTVPGMAAGSRSRSTREPKFRVPSSFKDGGNNEMHRLWRSEAMQRQRDACSTNGCVWLMAAAEDVMGDD